MILFNVLHNLNTKHCFIHPIFHVKKFLLNKEKWVKFDYIEKLKNS